MQNLIRPSNRATLESAVVMRESTVHGTGVFARRKIRAGECIIEYRGQRISWEEAQARHEARGGPLNHTFYFSLSDGRIIDGGVRGNAARFINHACAPNCEAREHDDGRVFLYALQDIARGQELLFDYALEYEGRHTPAIKRLFACRCGTSACTGSYLAPKRRNRARTAA